MKETTQKIQYQRRRSISCLPSCFVGSPIADDSDDPPVSTAEPKLKASAQFSSSKFQGKKKTLPSAAAAGGQKSSSSLKSSQGKGKKVQVNVNTESQKPRLPHISPKYATWNRPAPHSWTADPVRTASSSGHSGSPEPEQPVSNSRPTNKSDRTGKLDPAVGLSVLVVTLAVMLLFGRACAVASLCICFYVLPLLKAAAAAEAEDEGRERKDSDKVDVGSEEYKKRVVLEGLLERNGRRPPGVSVATSWRSQNFHIRGALR